MDNTMTTVSRSARGWLNGFIGVLIFSGSLPATKAGITGFAPDFLTTARAALAGIAAVIILAVLRSNERPRPAFWFFSVLGSLFVMGFALFQGGESTLTGDLYMIAAVLLCGLGYAEGARLSRPLGSWQVICWALVLSLPLMLILSIIFLPVTFSGIPPQAWGGLIYVSLFSMLIGFFFWYRGLAEGGITGVSQLQLLQPFFGLVLSAWLLDETVSSVMIASTCGVIACVAGSKRFSR